MAGELLSKILLTVTIILATESALPKLYLRRAEVLVGFTVSAPRSYYPKCCSQEQSYLPLRVHLSCSMLSESKRIRVHALRHFELLSNSLSTEISIGAAESVPSRPLTFRA
jgi:hypothetical protein